MKKPTTGKHTSPIPFIVAAVILSFVLIFLGVRTLNVWSVYQVEAAITSAPTPSVHPIDVTNDPTLITDTPAPTAVYMTNGSAGEGILALQRRLQELGYYDGEVDGKFGSGTERAVKLFQSQHDLSADGIVGTQTWDMLNSENAHQVVVTPTPQPSDTLAQALPVLVNAQHPVGDSFYPADLVYLRNELPSDLMILKNQDVQGVKEAVDALAKMVQAAKNEGISPWQISEAYRSYERQADIFNNSVQSFINQGFSRQNAISATRQTVADPGTSEHHTGLAFDITVPGESFGDTAQYAWMSIHCWEYGFILRYTDDKQDITGFLGEEWHYRYVGIAHSMRMKELGFCLEEYVNYLAGGGQ